MEGDVACLSEEEAGTGIGNLMKINQTNFKNENSIKEIEPEELEEAY